MRTETIKIYTYDELSKEAKEKAREQYRNTLYEFGDAYNWIVEDIIEDMDQLGLPTEHLQYDFNYANLSIAGYFDAIKLLKEISENRNYPELQESIDELMKPENIKLLEYEFVEIDHNWEINLTAVEDAILRDETDDLTIDIVEAQLDTIQDRLGSITQFLGRKYKEQMIKDEEYFHSDEAIEENIQSNEYEFLENGERY